MSSELRLRRPWSTEPFERYAFAIAWPVIWILPYGLWTWVIVFVPDVVVALFKWIRTKQAPILVRTVNRGESVDLVDLREKVIDSLRPVDVDAITLAIEAHQRANQLRIARTNGKALIFDLPDGATPVATALGLDVTRARRRYKAVSRAVRLSGLFILGIIAISITLFTSPDPMWLPYLVGYTRFVTMPLSVLLAIPTMVDVGADGIAWRWLFVRGYLPFASVTDVRTTGKVGKDGRPNSVVVVTKVRNVLFASVKDARELPTTIIAAWKASKERVEPADVDAKIARASGEDAGAWVRRLRASAAGAGAYRGTSLDHLWRLAEDDATRLDERLAALVVLCANENARERARTLAGRIVDPDARAAFEAASEGRTEDEIAPLFEKVIARHRPS